MKSFAALSALVGTAAASDLKNVNQVVKLIADLKSKAEQDGKNEQAAFDKYACWCENTLERKSGAISDAKELISETEILIKKLKGEIASHGAEIAQLTKDLAANAAAVKDATAVRDKEFSDYHKEKVDNENCVGALEQAIKVLTGAGTGKFLDVTSHKVQLLSISGGLSHVLRRSSFPKSIEEKDIELIKSFAEKPMDFFDAKKGMVAAQVGQNPFGDYAPQSTQIQGILQGMYDAFTADIEKDNAAEAESEKSFRALMATKQQEKETLQATLQKQETDSAEKTKKLSESKILKDDTAEQLEADEAFFADTKEACQAKATEWSVRTRLRTEELNGMATAISILSSKDAKATFKASTTTFMQVSSVKHQSGAGRSAKAFSLLKSLAGRYKSIAMANMAVDAQSGGHFDKVISQIDMMMADLRAEEQDDIAHRDRCENQQNANANQLEDLEAAIKKTNAALKRMGNTNKELQGEISELEKAIASTKKNQADLLDMRNEEVAAFRQALKDDADAINLLKQAIQALSKFYKDNKIALELAQQPEYAQDEDKAPSTWSGEYGGRKSESTGILAILSMLVEDTQKEIAEGRADDADAQAKYLKQNGALQATLDAQEETKANTEQEKADLEDKMQAFEKYKNGKSDDKDAEGDTQKAIGTECAWVKTHFESRRQKRKDEIQGLVDAKAFLSGSSDLP